MISDDPILHINNAKAYLRVAEHNSKERSKWAIESIEEAIWELERARDALKKISQDPKWDIN